MTAALVVVAALAAQPGGAEDGPRPAAGVLDELAAPLKGPAHFRSLSSAGILIDRFQCNRCHVIEGFEVSRDRSCVDCHRAILSDEVQAPAELRERWKGAIVHLTDVPDLNGLEGRLSPEWIARYLQRPHDLRRGLGESMPRLPLPADDARAIADWLTGGERPSTDKVPVGDATRGLKVLEAKGCVACHAYGGTPRPLAPGAAPAVDGATLARGIKLAPDLRWTRDRTTRAAAWKIIEDPRAVRRDAVMPKVALSGSEIADVVAALFDMPLPLPPAREPLPRLPPLARKVRFAEVQERVLKKTCIHCHAEDSRNLGVGGPGSSGGFGFLGTGLVLTSYARTLAGSIKGGADYEQRAAEMLELGLRDTAAPPTGEHRSIFRPVESGPMKGAPLLVAQLRARQLEEAGEVVPGVVGMPLGLPAITLEELQLVESWVAQGRPQ